MKDQIGSILAKNARDWGATEVRIEQGGKHPRLVGRLDAKEFVFAFPSTPGDRRSWRNCLSDLRRKLGVSPGHRGPCLAPVNPPRKASRKAATTRSPAVVPQPLHEPGDDLFFAPLASLQAAMQERLKAGR